MEKLDYVVQRLEDVKDTVDKTQEDVSQMKLNIARNTDSLDWHIKRTDLLESHVKMIENRLSISYLLKLSLSAATGLGAIAGAIYSIIKLLQFFYN